MGTCASNPIDFSGSALLAYASGPTLQAGNTGPLTVRWGLTKGTEAHFSAPLFTGMITPQGSQICYVTASIRTPILSQSDFASSTTERSMLNIKQRSNGQCHVIDSSSNRRMTERAYTSTHSRY